MPNYVYIATSLDGFIAKEDGDLDWLMHYPNPENSDYGFAEFIENIDALLMGRKTFETLLGFGDWPYEKPVFVLSRSLTRIPENLGDRAELIDGDVESVVERLRGRGYERIYVDGGKTIQ